MKKNSNKIKRKYKKSLMYNFSLSSILIISLFIIILIVTYYKIDKSSNFINQVTNNSIPRVIENANIYSTVKEMSYLTDKIANSNNKIELKLTFSELDKNISIIKKFKSTLLKNNHLTEKFKEIEKGLINLKNFVKRRLSYEESIKKHLKKLNLIFDEFTISSQNKTLNLWNLNYIKTIYMILNVNNIKNFKQLSKINNNISKNIDYLDKNASNFKEKKLNIELKKYLFKENGLLNLMKNRLETSHKINRIDGFNQSLLKSFTQEVVYFSLTNNNNLLKNIIQNSSKLKNEVIYLVAVFIIFFICFIIFIFYYKQKIISRLVNLDEYIQQRLKGNKKIIKDDRNDEISYINNSFNYFASMIEEQNKKLQELSLTDSLTNIPNRRMFNIAYKNELKLLERYKHFTSIIIIDVDNFKLFNDKYGHLAGDMCLKEIAKCIKKNLKRSIDLVARYGGEEFICILPDSDIISSKIITSKIVSSIIKLKIVHELNKDYNYVTISAGIKTISVKDCKVGNLNIEKADKALYMAKQKGRNCFVHYDELN